MDEKLETFAAQCHDILKTDPGPSGLEAVREKLEPLLTDAEFVAAYLGPDKGARSAPPHDHGPSWAIYGQAKGETEMTEYDLVAPPSDGEPGRVTARKTYLLEPGMAVAYPKGALHAPKREDETRLIRMEGQNLEGVKRDKFELA
jgi:hypothetical protein